MPTVVNFNGKKVIEPGVYAQVKSGIPAKPSAFAFGNVLIIDTGKGKQWGGGSGINGFFANGINSVYSFEDVNDFKGFVKGGLFYDLADYIFNPLNGAPGPAQVGIVRAATTMPAQITYDFESGASGGNVKFLCKNEGEVGNGYTDETLGTATIRFQSATIIPANTIIINVDATIIGNFTLLTNSVSEALQGITDSINGGTSGYTATIQGTSMILYSARNVLPTTKVISYSGTVLVETGTPTAFTGYVPGLNLATGYGSKMRVSDDDPAKYVIEFFEGTFAGYTAGGNSINNLTPTQSIPNLVATSADFSNIDELIQWAKTDFNFNKLFELDPDYLQIGNGDILPADATAQAMLHLAWNGTSFYNAFDLDKVLEDIRELQNSFILSDCWGDEARGVINLKLLNHIKNTAEFDKFLIIGGGKDETKFSGSPNSSIEVAKFYNDTSVIVVHSGENRYNQFTQKKEKLDSIYHAANVVGRLGGLEPQVPLTFKALKIKEFNHPLGQKEREKALLAGVIHNRTVPGIGNVVNQGINTLQNNLNMINPDGTSPEISIMRIAGQLNKELILEMRPLFVGSNIGINTPEDVKAFVEGKLFSKTASSNQDNLIISFTNVTVQLVQDYYNIQYSFVPNSPINKLFITGFMLEANLNA